MQKPAHVLLAFAAVLSGSAYAQITNFPVPTEGSRPYTIVPGPDGNLWFTESKGNKIGRITTAGVITEFPVPTAGSGPYGIAVGRDGNIWFTERFGNKIGRFNPTTLHFAEFNIPTPFAQPWEIALGADGNLWFTEEDVNQIGRITPAGVIREFIPPTCCFPTGITAGPDGNMWFTLEIGDQIGRVRPTGVMTMFTIPNIQVLPWDITPGPDGNLWFTELAGRAVGRISTSGLITEFPVPGPFSGIAGVTAGPEGNLWFTENDTDHIGSIDTAGVLQQPFLNVQAGARPLSIVLGPDGNLWFTQADKNAIGRVRVDQPSVTHVLSMDATFVPVLQQGKLGGKIQWTFLGPNAHSVVDASGLGLFDSGMKTIVGYYELAPFAAGTFMYRDGASITPNAFFTVPVYLPPSGTVGSKFRVTWSMLAQLGIVYDVEVKEPGAAGFVPWTTTANTGRNYTPLVPGTYQFRSRVRNPVTGLRTFYSIPASIQVQ